MRYDKTEIERALRMDVWEMSLSVRAQNCLDSEGIVTVLDLVVRTDLDLLAIRNFGETTLKEVKWKLAALGLRLGMRLKAGKLHPHVPA
jgi:DNA-directed RNA polymerase subunit alpha